MENIRVEYDGSYPTMCMGVLKIYVSDKKVYEKQFVCHSSGSVWFDKDWCEHVESGTLTWDSEEAKEFSQEIVSAVNDKLSNYSVCCGGCV